ncbi:Six-hairpin glycosidase-like protein [Echria macrotheca]|uniref:Six-hairpin glycosidase-like protein n=1 Tax=Echria macrotheca TaxID=438768 RepID=A0AAJ0B9I4_9PEZI|nr:Six-hairpin glycosidase-like protein [Echria macrotheca]
MASTPQADAPSRKPIEVYRMCPRTGFERGDPTCFEEHPEFVGFDARLTLTKYERTSDAAFFAKYGWVDAVQAAVDAAGAMRLGTYDKSGEVQKSAWTFTSWTNRGSETLTNDGLGNQTKGERDGADRLPAVARRMYLPASLIVERLPGSKAENSTTDARICSGNPPGRRQRLRHRDFGDVFAYEVDGFGSANPMDDANIPSLLAMPLLNYSTSRHHADIYRNTRRFVLSEANPYYAKGPVLSVVGGPTPWPR